MVDQIDGAQVARSHRAAEAARRRGWWTQSPPVRGQGLSRFKPIQEDDAGLTRLPGGADDGLEHRPGAELSGRPAWMAGSTKIIAPDPDSTAAMKASVRPTEILKLVISLVIVLAGNKVHDIGVVHPENTHIGPPTGTALLHRLGGGVEDLHEGDGAAGYTARWSLPWSPWPAAGRRKNRCRRRTCGSSAAFLMASKMCSMESSTGSTKQAESWPSGLPAFIRVGRVGEKVQAGHQLIKEFGRGRRIGLGDRSAASAAATASATR